MIAKEEGDSSQVNQAYDRTVALQDKSVARDVLGMLRATTSISKGVVDQWGLVHVMLQCLLQENSGKAWEVSFIQVNMHPKHRLSFEDWIQKLVTKGVLQSGDTFQGEGDRELDKFSMLPDFWKGMHPTERQHVICVVKAHQNQYTVDCLKQLHTECSLTYSDMQKVRVCCVVSEEHPESVLTERGQARQLVAYGPVTREKAAATTQQENVAKQHAQAACRGLINFQRVPAGMVREELLDHMTLFMKRRCRSDEKLQPSPGLDIAMSKEQEVRGSTPSHPLLHCY